MSDFVTMTALSLAGKTTLTVVCRLGGVSGWRMCGRRSRRGHRGRCLHGVIIGKEFQGGEWWTGGPLQAGAKLGFVYQTANLKGMTCEDVSESQLN